MHKDQTCFISGRYLGENIRIMYDILHHNENKMRLKGLLLFEDFEKAFDSMSWSFIHIDLELFIFGLALSSWIKVFKKNAKLAVNKGRNPSSFFTLGEAVDKGSYFNKYICFNFNINDKE